MRKHGYQPDGAHQLESSPEAVFGSENPPQSIFIFRRHATAKMQPACPTMGDDKRQVDLILAQLPDKIKVSVRLGDQILEMQPSEFLTQFDAV